MAEAVSSTSCWMAEAVSPASSLEAEVTRLSSQLKAEILCLEIPAIFYQLACNSSSKYAKVEIIFTFVLHVLYYVPSKARYTINCSPFCGILHVNYTECETKLETCLLYGLKFIFAM